MNKYKRELSTHDAHVEIGRLRDVLERVRHTLMHKDSEYEGDHWASGCLLCAVEVALGMRNPNFGGKTLAENARLANLRCTERMGTADGNCTDPACPLHTPKVGA